MVHLQGFAGGNLENAGAGRCLFQAAWARVNQTEKSVNINWGIVKVLAAYKEGLSISEQNRLAERNGRPPLLCWVMDRTKARLIVDEARSFPIAKHYCHLSAVDRRIMGLQETHSDHTAHIITRPDYIFTYSLHIIQWEPENYIQWAMTGTSAPD